MTYKERIDALKAERDEAIVTLYKAGASHQRIAEVVGSSITHVTSVIKEAGARRCDDDFVQGKGKKLSTDEILAILGGREVAE